MALRIIRQHKLLSCLCAGGLGSGIYLADPKRRIKASQEYHGLTRSLRFGVVFTMTMIDYKWSFRNVDAGSDEYNKVYHETNLRCAQRALRLCKELGGYYIKFGQMVSSLDQGIPHEWIDTMSQCQDKAKPVPFSQLASVIEDDLGQPASEIFQEIDEEPLGAASLAQVHHAILKNGDEVAVKIQYPAIRKYTLIDMRDCDYAARLTEILFPSFEFSWFIPRFRNNVLEEIDFTREVTNMQNCREFFSSNPSIYVPKVYPSLSSHRICMMEYIKGIKVNNIKELKANAIDTRKVAQLCVEAVANMMFQAPFLHVDPHAGNLLVRKTENQEPQLVLLDHGMYNYFDPGFTSFMQDLWLAMVAQDTKKVEELCSIYGMERFASLLALSMTGRSLDSKNKFGEEMTVELRESVEDRITDAVRNVTMEIFTRRMEIISDMMKAMPRDLMYVFRVIEMMRGLLHLLGGNENDRLAIMTTAAIKGRYTSERSYIPWYITLQWKFKLLLLRLQLWLNDLYIEFYVRNMMKGNYEMEFDPDVVFEHLIKPNKQKK